MKFVGQGIQKLRAETGQTFTETDATECITMLHSQVVKDNS